VYKSLQLLQNIFHSYIHGIYTEPEPQKNNNEVVIPVVTVVVVREAAAVPLVAALVVVNDLNSSDYAFFIYTKVHSLSKSQKLLCLGLTC